MAVCNAKVSNKNIHCVCDTVCIIHSVLHSYTMTLACTFVTYVMWTHIWLILHAARCKLNIILDLKCVTSPWSRHSANILIVNNDLL